MPRVLPVDVCCAAPRCAGSLAQVQWIPMMLTSEASDPRTHVPRRDAHAPGARAPLLTLRRASSLHVSVPAARQQRGQPSCARSIVHLHAGSPVQVNSMTTAFDGGGNTVRRAPQQSTQPRDEACLSERAACSLGSPLVHRRSIRVARRAGRVGLRVCAHRTGQASPPASCCMSYSPRACAAHAAVVRHACAPVALAGPCAAVATPSCDACVVGCDESGASGFEDIRPVRETAIPVAAYAGASRRDVSRHDAANGFANVCGIRVKKVPPSYYLLMYMLK